MKTRPTHWLKLSMSSSQSFSIFLIENKVKAFMGSQRRTENRNILPYVVFIFRWVLLSLFLSTFWLKGFLVENKATEYSALLFAKVMTNFLPLFIFWNTKMWKRSFTQMFQGHFSLVFSAISQYRYFGESGKLIIL